MTSAPKKPTFFDLLKVFLVPLLVGKMGAFYFGSLYSAHPGEGYGYLLIFFLGMTVVSLVLFAWKFRHYDDT